MKKYSIVLITALLLILTACGETNTDTNGMTDEDDKPERIKVMTTLYPLQYFAAEIGGDAVEATSILPAGSDAHSYEPTSKEMIAVAEADLFIYNEKQAESYALKIEEALADEDVTFLEASKGLDMITYLHDHDHDHEKDSDHTDHDDEESHDHDADELDEHGSGDYDTHVWLSPQLAKELSANILTELIQMMPEKETEFTANYNDLVTRLEALDGEFKDVLSTVPNKTILVTHAAYNYWSRDYGIEQLAVTGLSPSNEPSQKQLIDLIALVENRSIKTILFEQNISSKVSEVIRDEAGLKTAELHNLSTLRTEDIENDEDYFSLMERNLKVLEQVLSE